MANKRKYTRFIKRCETEFAYEGAVRRGISSDFSMGGLFIRTDSPFPEETELDIVLYPQGMNAVTLKGRVRRAAKVATGRILGVPTDRTIKKNGMGIELVGKNKNYVDFFHTVLMENKGPLPEGDEDPADNHYEAPAAEPAAKPRATIKGKVEDSLAAMVLSLAADGHIDLDVLIKKITSKK